MSKRMLYTKNKRAFFVASNTKKKITEQRVISIFCRFTGERVKFLTDVAFISLCVQDDRTVCTLVPNDRRPNVFFAHSSEGNGGTRFRETSAANGLLF